ICPTRLEPLERASLGLGALERDGIAREAPAVRGLGRDRALDAAPLHAIPATAVVVAEAGDAEVAVGVAEGRLAAASLGASPLAVAVVTASGEEGQEEKKKAEARHPPSLAAAARKINALRALAPRWPRTRPACP